MESKINEIEINNYKINKRTFINKMKKNIV